MQIINKFITNKYLLFLIIFYFIIRIFNLTSFPIFNDEAIYLDWGWRETHQPGYLYYSLYDAKPPFLMWIFGIMQHLLLDPLFAGRIVSVFAGLITLLGIYKISKKLFNQTTALLAVFIYTIIPLFSFYDRQALMESSISAVGIWAGYLFLNLAEKKNYKYAIFLGLVLGIGFFIKFSAFVFLFSFFIAFLYLLKISSQKIRLLEILVVIIFIFLSTVFLLIINPEFWKTLSTNSRFTLTIGEVFSLPFSIWIKSFYTHIKIMFFYLTPLLLVTSLIGFVYVVKKTFMHKLFLFYFIASLLITTLLVRGGFDRYVVSFLPFFVICSSFFLTEFFSKSKLNGYILIILCLTLPLILTIYQVINLPGYIQVMEKISGYGHSGYLNGFTSGYGVDEALSYFKNLSKNGNFAIGIAQNTGNPESAFNIYFNKNINVKTVYMDGALFKEDLSKYHCLSTGIKTYFISRDYQQAGLERFFEEITRFNNKYGNNSIGVYKVKENCKGNTLKLSIVKT